MTYFEPLRQSGLPLDWTTISVGWTGIGDFDRLLTLDQLRDYALERLVSVAPDQENAVVALAFVEDGDFWTIKRCLEQLASDAPEDAARAKRVWRWVCLNETVTHLEQEALREPRKEAPHYDEWANELFADIHDALIDIWVTFDFPIGELTASQDSRTNFWWPMHLTSDEILHEYRDWLTREYAKLQTRLAEDSARLTAMAASPALAKIWDTAEEDAAWVHL